MTESSILSMSYSRYAADAEAMLETGQCPECRALPGGHHEPGCSHPCEPCERKRGKENVMPDQSISEISRAARIVAKHLVAMADELDQPDVIIKFDKTVTAEQVQKFIKVFSRGFKP